MQLIYNVHILEIGDYSVIKNETRSFVYKADAQKYFNELVDTAKEEAYSLGWYDEDDAIEYITDTDDTYEIGEPFYWATNATYIHLTETKLE